MPFLWKNNFTGIVLPSLNVLLFALLVERKIGDVIEQSRSRAGAEQEQSRTPLTCLLMMYHKRTLKTGRADWSRGWSRRDSNLAMSYSRW